MHLETERTVLREFYPEDAYDLHEILGDAITMEYIEPPYDFEKTEKFLQEFCIARKGALAAVHKGNRKVIGYVLFHPLEREVYEIGWIFNRSYWRQGYGFEACGALVQYAFSALSVHKICAETTDAVKSAGLMRKLGMRLEGVQRRQTVDHRGAWVDLHLYGLLREDLPD